MYEYDLFLSHNGADKEWVEKLAIDIEKNGDGKPLRVFFDKWDIEVGADIPISIENALEKSRFLGLVMSPEALASEWVAMERSTVIMRDPSAKRKTIIPIYRRDCNIPHVLKRIKYLDFSKEKLYQSSLEQLLAILRDMPIKRGKKKSIEEIQLQEDQNLLEELMVVFERPAFRVPCIKELFLQELKEAIDDTQAVLNTGKLYSRNHNLIREMRTVSSFQTNDYRKKIEEILDLLCDLKRIINEFEIYYELMTYHYFGRRDFSQMYFNMSICVNGDEDFIKEEVVKMMDNIDTVRNNIINLVNSVNRNSQRQLPLIELSSTLIIHSLDDRHILRRTDW